MPNPRKQQQQRQQQQRNHANVQRIYQGQGRIRNKRPSTARTSRPSTAGIRKKKKSSGGSVKRNTRPPSAALSRRDRTVHRALQKTFKQQPLPSREKRLKKKRAVTSVDFDVSASLSGDDEESADANIIQMNLDNGSSDTQSYDQDEMDLLSALN
jgi:hypothetical protein